jgi:hypothetical protein
MFITTEFSALGRCSSCCEVRKYTAGFEILNLFPKLLTIFRPRRHIVLHDNEITRKNFIPLVIFLFLGIHIVYRFKSKFLSTDPLPSSSLQKSSYSDSLCHKLTSDVILRSSLLSPQTLLFPLLPYNTNSAKTLICGTLIYKGL